MSLARFASANVKAISFVTLVLCAIGLVALGSFPVAILPDVTFPRIVVIVDAGDRPARQMEVSVTRPLEEALATVPGIRKVRSKTQRGASEISADLSWGADMLVAQQLCEARVNQVRQTLPPGVTVSVERANPTLFPVYGISLQAAGLTQSELWSLATYQIRPRLARVPGVARVVVQGGRIPELVVTLDPGLLTAYHLAAADVEQAIAQSNTVRAVGRVDYRYQQLEVLIEGGGIDASRLGDIVIAQRAGSPILLRQVAKIVSSVQDRTTIVTADGAESVLVNIVRQPDANSVAVVQGVRAELDRIRPSLPRGARLNVFYNQADLIEEAIGSVRDAVLIGGVLAIGVLLLFLRDIRATLITAAIIPSTVLITFLIMRLAGLSLNLMTLGALAIGTGLVIDDAIVVVENVFRHMGEGMERQAAVAAAAGEIAAPMISSTITTVVVFLPLVLLAGVTGAFFTALAITLTISVMVSLVLALLLSPSLCAAFLRSRGAHGHAEERGAFAFLIRVYGRALRIMLRWPAASAVGAAGLIVVTLLVARSLPTGFMPAMDEGAFILDYTTPPGTSLAESDRLLKQVEAILAQTPEVAAYSRRTGTELGFAITEPNRGDFAVLLKPRPRRPIDAVIDEVRGKITAQTPGLDIDFSQVLQDLIGDLAGAPAPIEIKLFGEDAKALNRLAPEVAAKLQKIPGVTDVKPGLIESGPELVAHVDPIRAGRVGLTASATADQANLAMFGDVATELLQGDRQLAVRVRYPAAVRSDPDAVGALPIRTPAGYTVPLRSLADMVNVPGTYEVNREDQRRLTAPTARLANRDLGSVMRDVNSMMAATPLPAGVTFQPGGQFQSQNEAFDNLKQVLGLAIVLVFSVMLFQFRAFTPPLVIMIVMPLAMFGVVMALRITGMPINVSSLMGSVMLVGIVVKNGILLLDQAQAGRAEGLSVEEAVVRAGQIRMRPILMTTLTALLGLLPLALGWGAGAEMQQPLAIAVIGGLTLSTLFTLLLAPVVYVSAARFRHILFRNSPGHNPRD